MTDQQTAQTPAQTAVASVIAPPGSRLEQLQASYADAKAAASAADDKLRAIVDAIKVELTRLAAEGSDNIQLAAGAGPALRLSYVERWTFDSRRFKAVDPENWVRYAKKGGSWVLKQVGGGES